MLIIRVDPKLGTALITILTVITCSSQITWKKLYTSAEKALEEGQYYDAHDKFEEAARIAPDELALVRSIDRLAFLRLSVGKFEEADSLYQQSIALYREIYGPVDTNLADVLYRRAHLLDDKLNRNYEAYQLYRQVLDIDRQTRGECDIYEYDDLKTRFISKDDDIIISIRADNIH